MGQYDYTHVIPRLCDETGSSMIRDVKEGINEIIAILDVDTDKEAARCLAIARTNLEQAAMWATKGLVIAHEVYVRVDERA